jgi:Na+/phosphate symporter
MKQRPNIEWLKDHVRAVREAKTEDERRNAETGLDVAAEIELSDVLAYVDELETIAAAARKLVDQSYTDSHGRLYISNNEFNDLTKILDMKVSNVRPWQR